MSAERLLICTDLDRTLIPNGAEPESPSAAQHFEALVSRPDVVLAYVSGRHKALVEGATAEYRLPLPDYVIGDVGTSLYRVGPDRTWAESQAWHQRIGADWAGQSWDGLAAILSDVAPLRLQEEEKQNRYKLSYYLDDGAAPSELITGIEQRLFRSGVRARIVSSIDDLTGQGLLDILPATASKRHAVEALMDLEHLSLDRTVFCGDSGNDMEVFLSPVRSVVVANARDEIKHEAAFGATAAGREKMLYVARGGFLGMNGNYRGGMLEGIAHYHPQVAGFLARGCRETDGACA